MKFKVHLEPKDFKGYQPENCVDCKQPTRYWLLDKHTPLCEECCAKRNARAVPPSKRRL